MTNPTTITANPGEQVVDIERIIPGPIADVYRAYTEPELVKQWLGPHGYAMEISSWDDLDGIVANGMAMGVTQGFERLDSLLGA